MIHTASSLVVRRMVRLSSAALALVLAIGLLALAGMQGISLTKNVDANELTLVTNLAADMMERNLDRRVEAETDQRDLLPQIAAPTLRLALTRRLRYLSARRRHQRRSWTLRTRLSVEDAKEE